MSDAGGMLGQAAALEPQIRERVLTLANLALDQCEFLIKHGEPGVRTRLINSFMTTFAKEMRTQETNDEMEALRTEMRKLQEAVAGRTPGDSPTAPLVAADGPAYVEVQVDGPGR